MSNWSEWAYYWHEKKKRSRKFAENTIEWKLPAELLPVRNRKVRRGYRIYVTQWYVNRSYTAKTFVYLLKDRYTNTVRYVGLTDDPPRRLMEHRRNNVLHGQFRMVVIAVGGPNEEREWIDRYKAEGYDLLNIVGNQSDDEE